MEVYESFLSVAPSGLLDNELLEWPTVQCNAENIQMHFTTKKTFQGKVYVKGHYSHPECRVQYGSGPHQDSLTREIKIDHGTCDMTRQRMVPPEGVMLSTVLVISFHPLFITKSDKMFSVKCMYNEHSRSITANLYVSSLPSEQLPFNVPSPMCSYTIRKDSLDGDILSFAKVGDQVVHRWNCDSVDYGILVHSCTVEDGQGQKQLIIDDDGCHTDRLLLGDPTYVGDLNMAYRESSIFKFADQTSIRFRCEIRLCYKHDGGCEGVTPPMCLNRTRIATELSTDLSSTSLPTRKSKEKRSAAETKSDASLFSQTLVVLDDDDFEGDSRPSTANTRNNVQTVCLPFYAFLWTSVIISAGVVLSLTVVAIQCQNVSKKT
ncbi:hypothetical protein Q1695_000597 [Nippostrongylus brasiliensis]|nr:hypothetical protein Q1695_000597 [Nippostrongylus brasiliensis]